MNELMALWLPILLAAVAVHIASFLAWVVLPHHKSDWKPLPNEPRFLESLRSLSIAPGQHMFPYACDPQKMKDPEFQKLYKTGPHGVLHIWPGPPNMPRNMSLTFLFYIVTGIFVAYLATLAVEPGAPYLEVFRVVGAVSILAYCFASIPQAIWFNKSLRSTAFDILDGVVYALLTAGIFSWLWPAATVAVDTIGT